MSTFKLFAGTLALLASAAASAQSTPSQSTDPAAASSPHQRQTTGEATAEQGVTPSPDPDAAASPHQREVTDEGASKSLAAADPVTFVSKAAQGGMTEVALAKLALSKTSNSSVQSFASRMVQDHGKANDELMAIASRNNLKAPQDLDAKHKSLVESFRLKNGKDFDAAYAQQMVKDHHETIALFEGATKSRNADISEFATKTLPTLQQHDAMARKLPAKP